MGSGADEVETMDVVNEEEPGSTSAAGSGPMPSPEDSGKGKGKASSKKSAVVGAPLPDQLFNGLPWVEKFRPASLGDLVAHDDIIAILTRLMKSNQLPHLLFYGPPGTGKTSTILACAKQMLGSRYQALTLELNASDDRGIDVVRDQIKAFAGTKQLFSSGLKLVILDEADHMTSDAQFALRRVIEKYTQNTRFCLICNYVSKIIPALQSRCTRFRFAPLRPQHVRDRVKHVADSEGLKVTDEAVEALVRLGQGDMRRVLNVMQATSMAYPDLVDEESVYLCSGNPLPSDMDNIMKHLFNDNYKEAFRSVHSLCVLKGYSMADILRDVTIVLNKIDLPPKVLAYLYSTLSEVEYQLSSGASEKLQMAAMVGAFIVARHMME